MIQYTKTKQVSMPLTALKFRCTFRSKVQDKIEDLRLNNQTPLLKLSNDL